MHNSTQSFEILNIGSQNFIPQQNAFAGRRGLPLKETYYSNDIIRINDGGNINAPIEFCPIIPSIIGQEKMVGPNDQELIQDEKEKENMVNIGIGSQMINTSALIARSLKSTTNNNNNNKVKSKARGQSKPRSKSKGRNKKIKGQGQVNQSKGQKSQVSKKASKSNQMTNRYMTQSMSQIGEEQCSIDEDEYDGDQVMCYGLGNKGNNETTTANAQVNFTSNDNDCTCFFKSIGINDILTKDIDEYLPENYSSQQQYIERSIRITHINELEQTLVFEFEGEQGYYQLYFDSKKKESLIVLKGKVITCILSENNLYDNYSDCNVRLSNPNSRFITYTLIRIVSQ